MEDNKKVTRFETARQMKQEDGKRLISLHFANATYSAGVCTYPHTPGNHVDFSVQNLDKQDLIDMVRGLQRLIGEIESES